MKKLALFLALCLCLTALTCCFTSCQKEESKGGSMEAEADKEFSFLFAGLDPSDLSHPASQAMKKFQEDTGRTIQFSTVNYGDTDQKLTAAITSGNPYDVIHAGADNFPHKAIIGYTQDITPYCDIKRPSMDENLMKSLFSYQGGIHGASPKDCAKPFVIFFNEDMFVNEGLATPKELYNQGKWTFDTFKEVAMKFTKDTDGDGTLDRWGVAAWYPTAFFSGSGASVCNLDKNGRYTLNMDSNPQLLEALELIQSAWSKDHWVGCAGDKILESFYQGNNAMLNDYSWSDIQIQQEKEKGTFTFNYDVAPFPYGVTNDKKTNSCFADGFSIMAGCDAPYTAGKFLEYLTDAYVADNDQKNEKLDPEHVKLYKEMNKNIFNATQYDSAVDKGSDLCAAITNNGMDIQQAIETFKPFYSKMVENANKKMANKQDEFASAMADAVDGNKSEGK